MRVVLGLGFIWMALYLGACGTLGGAAGGGDNLPTAWVLPFDALTDGNGTELAPLVLPSGYSDPRAPWVVVQETGYVMYLAVTHDGVQAIYRATSSDGRSYSFEAAPVLDLPTLGQGKGITTPTLVHSAGKFELWFAAADGSGLGYATSSDGTQFTVVQSVVLSGDQGWERRELDDVAHVTAPSVLRIDGMLHLWYAGGDGRAIAHAVSTDGVSWTKDSAPLISRGKTGSWNGLRVDTPRVTAVTLISGRPIYRMYYSGSGKRAAIGFAASYDATSWSEFSQNPIFDPASGANAAQVIPFAAGALMFYEKTVDGAALIGVAGHRVN